MLALCHLLGPEAEPRGEIYSAATTRDQAAILFNEMVAIITAIPEFSVRVALSTHQKRIEVLHGEGMGSVDEALAADHSRGLGLAPTLWVYDELAAAKDRRLLDALHDLVAASVNARLGSSFRRKLKPTSIRCRS